MLSITPINEFSQLNLTIRLAKMETDIMVLFAKKKLSDDISAINAFDCEVIDLELELMQLGFDFSACSSKNWLIIENMAKYMPNAISAFKSGQERSIDMLEVSICYECQQNDGLPCSHHG